MSLPVGAIPEISVVIPTCDRPHTLARVLNQLDPGCQRVPADSFEVIVSDDSRHDETRLLVAQQFPHVRYVAGPRRGPASNRNRGAASARGEWLAFIDDDCQPIDGWLKAMADVIAATAPDVVEGKIIAPGRRESLFLRHVENLTGGCFWSANLAIRRDVFDRLGGFDEDFLDAGGEDLELVHRFRANALRTVFSEAAAVEHPSHVLTWAGVFRRAFTVRWSALYLLKTGQTLPLDAPMWKVVPNVVATRVIDLLRTSWRSARAMRRDRRIAALPQVVLNWLLFPVVLLYAIHWDIRFRRMLRDRHLRSA